MAGQQRPHDIQHGHIERMRHGDGPPTAGAQRPEMLHDGGGLPFDVSDHRRSAHAELAQRFQREFALLRPTPAIGEHDAQALIERADAIEEAIGPAVEGVRRVELFDFAAAGDDDQPVAAGAQTDDRTEAAGERVPDEMVEAECVVGAFDGGQSAQDGQPVGTCGR